MWVTMLLSLTLVILQWREIFGEHLYFIIIRGMHWAVYSPCCWWLVLQHICVALHSKLFSLLKYWNFLVQTIISFCYVVYLPKLAIIAAPIHPVLNYQRLVIMVPIGPAAEALGAKMASAIVWCRSGCADMSVPLKLVAYCSGPSCTVGTLCSSWNPLLSIAPFRETTFSGWAFCIIIIIIIISIIIESYTEYIAPNIWNFLPKIVTVADSLASFKFKLRTCLCNRTLGLRAAKPVCYVSAQLEVRPYTAFIIIIIIIIIEDFDCCISLVV